MSPGSNVWVVMAYRRGNPAVSHVSGPRWRGIRVAQQKKRMGAERVRLMSKNVWDRIFRRGRKRD